MCSSVFLTTRKQRGSNWNFSHSASRETWWCKCLFGVIVLQTLDIYSQRNLSETGRHVHLTRKQCLINRKRHRRAANEVRPDRKMKRSFFQAAVVSILLYGCTTWTLTKRLEKKARRQLHKNAASNIEQVLEATPQKAPTIRPPTSHHENYPSWTNQICGTLLEKQGRAHKWCTPMNPRIWSGKSRTTSSNIHTAALRGYGI